MPSVLPTDHGLLSTLFTTFFSVSKGLSPFLKTQIHNPTGQTGGSVLHSFDGAGIPYVRTIIFRVAYCVQAQLRPGPVSSS